MEFLLTLKYRSGLRKDVLLKVFYSNYIIPAGSIVNIGEMVALLIFYQFATSPSFSLFSCAFHVFFFGYVSNIVQCSM